MTTLSTVSPERINGRLLLSSVNEASELSTDVHKVTGRQILNAARVDWTVSKKPLYLPDGKAMPGAFGLVRDDTGYPLSVVGSQYVVNQNVDGLDAFDKLVEAHRATRRTGDNSSEDSRLASAWFGSGAALKSKAMELLSA